MSLIAKQEIWVDADGNAVPFGDPRGKSVLFGQGAAVSKADAEKYGIGEDGTLPEAIQSTQVVFAKSVEEAPSNKAVKGPAKSK